MGDSRRPVLFRCCPGRPRLYLSLHVFIQIVFEGLLHATRGELSWRRRKKIYTSYPSAALSSGCAALNQSTPQMHMTQWRVGVKVISSHCREFHLPKQLALFPTRSASYAEPASPFL